VERTLRLIACLFIFLLPAVGVASDSSRLGEELLNCRGKVSPAERLDCYDGLVVPGNPPSEQIATTVTEPAVEDQAPVVASGAAVADTFGKPRSREGEPEEVAGVVTELVTNATGKLRISLDNGQIWMQSDSRKFYLRTGDTVVVKKASFGSFLLSRVGLNASIRVKRID
jgi:hypothetical protein